VAPEVIQQVKKYDASVDIFSLGAMLYEILTFRVCCVVCCVDLLFSCSSIFKLTRCFVLHFLLSLHFVYYTIINPLRYMTKDSPHVL